MVQFRDIVLKRQSREAGKQNKLTFKRAVLVDEFGNQTTTNPLDDVWASVNERRVWHMVDGAVQPAQILCRRVSDPYVGLGVIIGYADGSNQLEVLSDDFFLTGTGDPSSWASTAPRDFEPGGRKMMWVYTKVITPLATYPDPSGLIVNVIDGDYPYAGTRKTFAGQTGIALTQNPNAGEHYLAGLYLDSANTLQIVYGASVVVASDPTEPVWPAGAFRLSAVRVNDTQTSIDFANDVFDRRMAWSDDNSGGWPFANVLTVSSTDPDADYTTIALAFAGASAGDIILLDAETYTLTAQQAFGAAITLMGQGPETIINCATNSVSLLLLNSAGAALRNLKITHSGAGILNSGIYITANATVENVTVTLSGAATANYAVLQQGGTATLTNVTATASGATTNHAYRNDTGDCTATITGGSYNGTQQDIYGERTGSTLNLYDAVLVNRLADWDGTIDGAVYPQLVAFTAEIYQGVNVGISDFVATINGAPSGTSVVYNAPSSGNEATIVPTATTQLAKMVLHNTTRGDSALISNVNTGTNTITLTANAPAAWANTDTITIRSQTNTSTIGSSYFVDFEIVSEVDPLAAGLEIELSYGDSGGAGQLIRLHPYKANVTAERRGFTTQSTQTANGYRPLPIISRKFCALWGASGATTVQTLIFRALKQLIYGL